MQNSAQINLRQSMKMLNLLSMEGNFTFQYFCERKDCKTTPSTLYGSFYEHKNVLRTLNEKGAGVFICVNETKGKIRRATNIVRVRALFADFDTPNPNRVKELLALVIPPSLIVESSPDKHHAYWILNPDENLPLQEFKPLQQTLASHLGSDPSVCDLPRVLRLAGFIHQKGEAFTSLIRHIGSKYTAQQLIEWISTFSDSEQKIDIMPTFHDVFGLGEPPEHIKLARQHRDSSEWNMIFSAKIFDNAELLKALQHIRNDDREIWLKVGMALKNLGLPEAYNWWLDWSKSSKKFNEPDQLKTWDSFSISSEGITIATVFHLAKEGGYKTCVSEERDKEQVIQTTDVLNLETEIKKLAKLSAIEYEVCRISVAEKLEMRATALDDFVKQARVKEQEKNDSMVEEVEPWENQVDGNALFNEIYELIKEYIVADDSTLLAATLWIAFTWCEEVMQIAPIACITAPEKRCGKTQFLSVLAELVKRPMPTSNITAAALFRSIAKWTPTLLIDEADSFMKDNEDLRGILNAGHSRKNAYVIRTVGDNHEPKKFNVWGAKAISGIGHLPDTLRDRSIILELRRKERHEIRKKLRNADAKSFEIIKQKLCRWSQDNMPKIKVSKPIMPDTLSDRAQDNWEPLFMIAECISDEWLEIVNRIAIVLSIDKDDALSVNELLLTDIHQIFQKTQMKALFTEELINYLCQMSESKWRVWNRGTPLTARQLSDRLCNFRIRSKDIHKDGKHLKGYRFEDFKDTFNRYIPIW